MKKVLILVGMLSITAHAAEAACNNRMATVIMKPQYANTLIMYAMANNSMPMGAEIKFQTAEIATVEVYAYDDGGPGGFDSFDVAKKVQGFRDADPDHLGISRIVAETCYESGADPFDLEKGASNVGTIGH